MINLKIQTTRFGPVSIEADKIFDMPQGMPGFPGRQRFVLLPHRENSPFCWYQSTQEPALAFVITNPLWFKPDYHVELAAMLKELSWEADIVTDCLKLYVIVNIPPGAPEKMTANLIGPLLLNCRRYQAVQMLMADSPYSHRQPLLSH